LREFFGLICQYFEFEFEFNFYISPTWLVFTLGPNCGLMKVIRVSKTQGVTLPLVGRLKEYSGQDFARAWIMAGLDGAANKRNIPSTHLGKLAA
jgi:hypothetical protein